jgi:hypothetical protein
VHRQAGDLPTLGTDYRMSFIERISRRDIEEISTPWRCLANNR